MEDGRVHSSAVFLYSVKKINMKYMVGKKNSPLFSLRIPASQYLKNNTYLRWVVPGLSSVSRIRLQRVSVQAVVGTKTPACHLLLQPSS